MPITLEKLFSATVSSSFEYMGETVNMEWAPSRYTGEMWDLAEKIQNDLDAARDEIAAIEGETPDATRDRNRILQRTRQIDRHGVRRFMSALLVSWDVLDGKKPYPTDEESLAKLDPDFLDIAFLSLVSENAADPTKPDPSHDISEPKGYPDASRPGSPSSGELTTSGSRRGT
jgi:hypothetical protein